MEISPHADAGHAAGIECEGVMEEVRSLSRKKKGSKKVPILN